MEERREKGREPREAREGRESWESRESRERGTYDERVVGESGEAGSVVDEHCLSGGFGKVEAWSGGDEERHGLAGREEVVLIRRPRRLYSTAIHMDHAKFREKAMIWMV